MKGICKHGNGLYITSHFNGTHVLVSLRNILIVMSEEKFFADWKIVEKSEEE